MKASMPYPMLNFETNCPYLVAILFQELKWVGSYFRASPTDYPSVKPGKAVNNGTVSTVHLDR